MTSMLVKSPPNKIARRHKARSEAPAPYRFDPRAETMPREQLAALQLRRLRATLRNAYENVPLHRRRLRECGAVGDDAAVSALMAMLERFAYFLVSRQLEFESDALFDTVTLVVHRGFFGAPLAA